MSYKLKALGLLILAAGMSSCGIFSDDKELPVGTRVSVLTDKAPQNVKTNAIPKASLPTAAVNRDWSQNGATAHHVIGNIHVSDKAEQIWEQNFGQGASKRNLLLAAPVVFENVVYTQDVNGTISAFNLNDGKKIWRQKLKPLTEHESDNGLNGSGIAVNDDALFASAGFGGVFALNRRSGDVLWRKDIASPLRTAPTVCDNKVIIQTLDNRILALDTKDGGEIWKYNISAEDTVLAGSSTPACLPDKNLVVAGFSNGEIQAFNADIGYPLWSTFLIDNSRINISTDINAIKAAPVIDDDTVYAIGHNDLLAAIDYRTGENKWTLKIGGTNMPWIAGKYLFVLANNNELFAINKSDGKIFWQTSLLTEYPLEERSDIYLTGPMMINNQLIVTASDGTIYKISATDGNIMQRRNIGNSLPLAPIAAADSVIFATGEADLLVYK